MRCAHQEYISLSYGDVCDVIRVNMIDITLLFYVMHVSCHIVISKRLCP